MSVQTEGNVSIPSREFGSSGNNIVQDHLQRIVGFNPFQGIWEFRQQQERIQYPGVWRISIPSREFESSGKKTLDLIRKKIVVSIPSREFGSSGADDSSPGFS